MDEWASECGCGRVNGGVGDCTEKWASEWRSGRVGGRLGE
jgi:hypothetical protein